MKNSKNKKRKKKERIEELIKIPEDVKIDLDKEIKISGKKGETKKIVYDKDVKIEKKGKEIIISAKYSKKFKKKIGSIKAHIKNMIKGVRGNHVYKLKVCASHFPMNVSVEKNEFTVKNFLGEKIPRVLKLNKGVSIKVEGNEILIEGVDKELIAQTAADIEQLCKIRDKDKRIFQDGIFIINKDGKEIK